jgi:hypothetical protein
MFSVLIQPVLVFVLERERSVEGIPSPRLETSVSSMEVNAGTEQRSIAWVFMNGFVM